MGCSDVAKDIVDDMTQFLSKTAPNQWDGLIELLCENNLLKEPVHFAKFNFQQGKKRHPKNKLDVLSLTSDHRNVLDLHVVALIGSDGSEDHAVAVVNGMMFDSCAKHAMLVSQKGLDWCCNCPGGFNKTGHAVRFKITNCDFKDKMKNLKKK